MSIAQSETLKRDLTDKYVVVQEGIPELRRFVGLTGQVKTVNMNGRALVQFDGPVDISWYDISPAFLKVIPAPLLKQQKPAEKPAAEVKPATAKPDAAAPKPVAAKPAGAMSALEMARAQGAGSAKKPSALELARKQGAAGAAPAAPAPAPVTEAPTPVAEVAPSAAAPAPAAETPSSSAPANAPAALEKPKSIAEMIALAKQQGSGKK